MNILNKLSTLFFYFKPRKIVAQYKLFFGDEWLEASVESIAPYVYKILFVVSDVAWGDDKNNSKIKGDDLAPIISKLKEKYPNKIVVYNGSWNQQLAHVKAGLDYIKQNIPEASHCMYIDGDEIYTSDQITKLIGLTRQIAFFNKAIRTNYNTYFKTIYYKIYPCNYTLLLSLFPLTNWIQYRDARNVNAKTIDRRDLFFEHPAYVRIDDEKMRLKIEAHRETEPIIGDWYTEVWLKWTHEMKKFHPTNPEMWPGTIEVDKSELPEGMITTFEKWVNKNE